MTTFYRKETIMETDQGDHIIHSPFSGGDTYHNVKAFNSGKGICYITELAEETGEGPDDGYYTREDFLFLTNGNEQRARILFHHCNWQHPTTLLEEEKEDHCLFGEPGDDFYIPE